MGKTTIHYEMLQTNISQRSYISTYILDENNITLTVLHGSIKYFI